MVRFNLFVVLVAVATLLISCENSSVDSIESLNPLSDASETIVIGSGEESGGIADQLGDLSELTADGVFDDSKAIKPYRSKEWDEENQLWIIEIERERGSETGPKYGYFYRKYSLQFLDGEDQPMKFRVVDSDTAKTALFKSIEADGIFWNRRAHHKLNNLNIDWVVTDIDSEILNVNGTFERAAYDSLTTRKFTRTLNHQISLDIVDLKGPRGSRDNLSQKVSGDIYGIYDGEVEFTGNHGYHQSSIHKEFHINIIDGVVTITIDGENHTGDLETGELIDLD